MVRIHLLLAVLPLLATAQTVEQEAATGKQLAAEVERGVRLVDDPRIGAYVHRIAGQVGAGATLRTPLTIKLISGAPAYAIALPGGYCYLNTSLILQTANEAELAAAIAHQTAHLVIWQSGDPAIWRRTPAQPAALGTIPLIFSGGSLCLRATAGSSGGAGMAIPMEALGAARETESQADRLALEYLEKAGYDPGALADFYERWLRPGSTGRVFDPGIFPATMRTQAEALRNRQTFVVSTSEFEEIQRRTAKLSAAPAPGNAPSLKK